MKITSFYILLLITLCTFFSCSNSGQKNISINRFDKIKLIKFNKKKVIFETSFNFLNDSEKDITIVNYDFDIFIDNMDIASQLNMKPIIVKAGKKHPIIIHVEFEPKRVFKEFKAGFTKIKSDIIAEIKIKGTIKTLINEKEESIDYEENQKFLFTNDKKIMLNNKGEIVPIQ